MHRKLLLASVSAIAFSGSAALAADLPSRAPPPVYVPPAPIFTWTGIYIGGQVGYGWGGGGNSFSGFDPATGVAFTANPGGTPNGVIGGAHVGYQYQIQQFVLGLEGSVDGSSLSSSGAASFPDGTFLTTSSNADIQGSIRGKLGWAWDRLLIYATGGVAFGGFNTDVSVFNTGATNGGFPFYGSANVSDTRVGWTVGGGIEYAITNNWWVQVEYRYTDFGSLNTGFAAPGVGLVPVAPAFFNGSRSLTENQVQVGFSYRFDLFSPPPVVAKY
ncbi:MAG TPA: outer membrane beta-barrel protein [Methylocella sp.]|nr:outer membrane beta-barrel protein [Methylocella sp.]